MKPVLILLLLFFTYTSPAFAHGGVDDEPPEPVVSSKTASTSVNVPDSSPLTIDKSVNTKDGQYKFHIIQTPGEPHQDQEINFSIDITESVEGGFGGDPPVEDAKLKAGIREDNSSPEEVDITKKKPAGTYRFSYTFHKGATYQLTLSMVTNDNRLASLDFPVIVIGKPINYMVYGVSLLIFILIILAIFIFYRRLEEELPKNQAIKQSVIFSLVCFTIFAISIILLAKLLPVTNVQIATNTEVKAAPDNIIQVSKETQLLFNIATQEAGEHKIISGVTVSGAIKTKPQSKADVISPVAGRIQINSATVGTHVKKGKIIAVVEQILSVPETASINSTLADLRTRVADLQSRIEPDKAKIIASHAEYESSKIDLKAKTSELQTQIEQAKAKLEAANLELDRAQKLYNLGAAPLKRVQEAQFQVKSTELDLTASQKQKIYNLGSESIKRLRDAELQIKINQQELISAQKQIDIITNNQKQLGAQAKSFSLTAPISGTISDIRSSTGEQIEAGKPLISIINLDQVLIEAQVFEKDLELITSATEASFKVSSYPKEIFYINKNGPNKLLTIGSSVNPEKRTIPIIYEVNNASGKFRDGMFTEITIDTSGDKKVISVLRDAISDENGKKFVYIFKGGETFEKRQVTTGSEGQKDIEIPEGLKPGERVVTEGIYQLKSITVGKK